MEELPEAFQTAIAEFDKSVSAIVETLQGTVQNRGTPKTIFHYTNHAGLFGLIESGKFWISNAFKMNDPSEIKHGFNLLRTALESHKPFATPQMRAFLERFEAVWQRVGVQEIARCYVCSFSKAGDDLGQWRAYGDNGRGFALEFDTGMIESAFAFKYKKMNAPNSTFEVSYVQNDIINIQTALTAKLVPFLSLIKETALSEPESILYIKRLAVILSFNAMQASLFFKHNAYENEQEYRFLSVHSAAGFPQSVQFRSRPYGLIDYLEFDWRNVSPGALKKIIVGPAADHEAAIQLAIDCLRAAGLNDVEIEQSPIPYRVT